jgi:hypothetical protein
MNLKKLEKDSKNTSEMVMDFGERKVNTQNFSKTVVLPKNALSNCGCNLDDDLKVDVQVVQKGQERFLKLTPVCEAQPKSKKKKENGE